MSAFFGLDFGTSNSTLAMAGPMGARLIPLESGAVTLPSAVFWPDDRGALTFGRAALDTYLQGEDGRLLRGLKSTLGSALFDEKTLLGGRMVGFSTVIEAFFAHMKTHLDQALGDQEMHGPKRRWRKLRAVLGFATLPFSLNPSRRPLNMKRG